MRTPSIASIRIFLPVSLLVAVLSGLLYLPGLPGQFVFDDYPNIVNNEAIQLKELSAEALTRVIATPQPSGDMRNLPNLTFALDYWRAGGTDPAAFKTTNILIHALTAFALSWLLRSLLLAAGAVEARTRWAAPALALAWAAHPLLVSSVLYTVQRIQTMGTLFLVLALLAYLQARRAQIAGRPGKTGLLCAVLSWALAMGCKEDSVMLPAYTLMLELTLLRFDAADTRLAHRLRRCYLFAAVAAVALYLLAVIPHYWNWGAYPGRDFSTPERLLTQARVLCLYLWEIALPLPSHMPFFYDWLAPSRGLLQPWTTLPAIALLLALLAVARRLRVRQPLFALGILWFFGAHFTTSNVIGLELAYEHRNHFALIGAVLAISSLLTLICKRLRLSPTPQAIICGALLLALGGATTVRARSWSNNLLFSQASSNAAPHSARAWIQLCAEYYALGGGPTKQNTLLEKAIAACDSGSALAPDSLNSPALRLVLKTLRGDITTQDWSEFRMRMTSVSKSWDNRRAITLLTYNARRGVELDQQELLETFARQDQSFQLRPDELANIAFFILTQTAQPERAYTYLERAIKNSPPGSMLPREVVVTLRSLARSEWADRLEVQANQTNPPAAGKFQQDTVP